MVICTARKVTCPHFLVRFLQRNLIYFYWILYTPVLQSLAYTLKCGAGGTHVIDHNLTCYSGVHIAVVAIGVFALILIVALAGVTVVLYQRTEYSVEDALSQYFC